MRSSRLERKIYDILQSAEIPFKEEYIFPELTGRSNKPLRFDFAIFSDDGELDFLIEAQGEQHYKPVAAFGGAKALYRQQRNDAAKRKYCLDHNIKLVTIPYYVYNQITLDYILTAAGY